LAIPQTLQERLASQSTVAQKAKFSIQHREIALVSVINSSISLFSFPLLLSRCHVKVGLTSEHLQLIELARNFAKDVSHRTRLLKHAVLERSDHVSDR
jgi:hypothetical protein